MALPALPPQGSTNWYDHYREMDVALRAAENVPTLRPRGEFAAGVTYKVNDLIHVGNNSYYALIEHTSALPAPTTSSTYWKQLGSSTIANLPTGIVVERRWTGTAYPVRGAMDASYAVEWVGPSAPPLGGDYAIAGKDRWTVTP